MSIEMIVRVMDHSALKGSDLLVLLMIANYANDDGWAWPSVRTLAQRCRMSERAVQYAVRRIARKGELEVRERARLTTTRGGEQRVNVYRILVGDARIAPPPEQVVQPAAEGGAKRGKGGAIAVAPDPSVLQPSVEPSVTPPPLTPPRGVKGKADVGLTALADHERREAEEVWTALAARHGWPDSQRRRAREIPDIIDLLRAGFPKQVLIGEGCKIERLLSARGLHFLLNTHAIEQAARHQAITDAVVRRHWPAPHREPR